MKRGVKYLAAFLINILIISVAVLSLTNVDAFTVDIDADSKNVVQGNKITFNVSVDIVQSDPFFESFKIVLSSNGNLKECSFDRDGEVLNGCEGMTIIKLLDTTPGYGHGIYGGGNNTIIYNNVIAGTNGSAIYILAENTAVHNNILSKNSSVSSVGDDLTIANGVNVTGGYNIFVTDSSPNIVSGSYTNSGDSDQYNSNPLFVSSDNFSLQSSSPGKNAGLLVGLTRDFLGLAVPQGSAPEIGAYELLEIAEETQTPAEVNLNNPGGKASTKSCYNFTNNKCVFVHTYSSYCPYYLSPYENCTKKIISANILLVSDSQSLLNQTESTENTDNTSSRVDIGKIFISLLTIFYVSILVIIGIKLIGVIKKQFILLKLKRHHKY